MNSNSESDKQTNPKYVFWLNDPTVLYSNERYLNFLPSGKMTRIEQLNALTRFCIYTFILSFILNKSDFWIHTPLVLIGFIVLIYFVFQNDESGLKKELQRTRDIDNVDPEKSEEEMNHVENFASDFSASEKAGKTGGKIRIESGYYDSDGNLRVGPEYGPEFGGKRKNKIKYSYDETKEYEKHTCKKPTENNPFMNPDQTEFAMELQPIACDITDDDISDMADSEFNKNLFRDVSDIFNKENSQRMFYTVQQPDIDGQHKFASWLYGGVDNCKQDQYQCLRYEDLRSKR